MATVAKSFQGASKTVETDFSGKMEPRAVYTGSTIRHATPETPASPNLHQGVEIVNAHTGGFVIEDDPQGQAANDGLAGRRLVYALDEVEPLGAAEAVT